jgi:integrase
LVGASGGRDEDRAHGEVQPEEAAHAGGQEVEGGCLRLYELRHTCLTRWAEHMDPYTLVYLAGRSDLAMTKRYVHPQKETVRKAMEKARGGHASKTAQNDPAAS